MNNENTVLRDDIRQQISRIEKADIVVGIPSYNNAGTIEHVMETIQAGLATYFSDKKCVIASLDGGSTDGTMEIVRKATHCDDGTILMHHCAWPVVEISTPYMGLQSKGNAFEAAFDIASALDVRACVVVDSGLRGITPEWIELLIKPIMEDDFDFVAPVYQRHKYEGIIGNNIIYPLTRALYGKSTRQPIGGDFGFSGRLAQFYLTKNVWKTDFARYGLDIWMMTTAVANKFKVCQSFLGAQMHDVKKVEPDLSSMLSRVIGAAFNLMGEYPNVWKGIKVAETIPLYGNEFKVGLEPVTVNVDRMIEKFRLGVQELGNIWAGFISRDILDLLKKAASSGKDNFRIPDDMWAEIIYSFAAASHKEILNREHLLKSLTPLYVGRAASFIIDTWDSDAGEVDEKIEKLCRNFENNKLFLIVNWQ